MESFFRMRRSSHAPSTNQEPLIVVEESENLEKEEEISHTSSPRQSLDIDSPENPYLLSPWRDPRETRKHSLPTPPCTSGITASQVRRLSDQRVPSAREAAFLTTLYSSPAPQPGGRRHSVVTICKVPPTLFGRNNRRESIAALPAGQRSTASSRRESKTGPPPSTDHRASSATEINRCGDKDYPTPQTPQSSSSFKSITKLPPDQHASGSNLKKNRSNSFDISLYHNIKQLATGSSSSTAESEKSSVEPGWFTNLGGRHQPAMARRKSVKSTNPTVSFAKEAIDKLRDKTDTKSGDAKPKAKESRSPLSKLKWDGRSMVDARMIGNAIENFITGSSSSKKSSSSKETTSKTAKKSSSSWFGKTDDDDNDTCDSSLCSTLKDLFVK